MRLVFRESAPALVKVPSLTRTRPRPSALAPRPSPLAPRPSPLAAPSGAWRRTTCREGLRTLRLWWGGPEVQRSKSMAAHVAVRTPDSPSLGTQNSTTGAAAPRQSAAAHRSLVMAMCTGKSAHATAPARCMLEWPVSRGVGGEWRGVVRGERWRGWRRFLLAAHLPIRYLATKTQKLICKTDLEMKASEAARADEFPGGHQSTASSVLSNAGGGDSGGG